MHKQATGRQPWHFSGTNLTLGEALRLLLLLCGPPWLFAVFIILTRLAVPPATALEWILYVAAGPAAWGAFISAVADGRTLLGRPKESDELPHRLLAEIRRAGIAEQPETAGGVRAPVNAPSATDHSAISTGDGVAVAGHDNLLLTGPIAGNVVLPGGTLIAPDSATQAAREAEARAAVVIWNTCSGSANPCLWPHWGATRPAIRTLPLTRCTSTWTRRPASG